MTPDTVYKVIANSGELPQYHGHLLSILDRYENIPQLQTVLQQVKTNTPSWFHDSNTTR